MRNQYLPSIPEETIINKIYLIRGQKVMIDRDLADLYGVETKRLKEAVRRNVERFPDDFMFDLTNDEVNFLVSQNAIPSKRSLGGYNPYAFSEYGVLMLANVLKSSRALQMSIRIIEVFVKMREMLIFHKDILLQLDLIEKRVGKNSDDIRLIFQALKQLLDPQQSPRRQIGFKRNSE